MRRFPILATTAALAATAAFIVSSGAEGRGSRDRASQATDRADARTARIKAELRLTPDQDKNWASFAAASHEMAQRQADRSIALRTKRAEYMEGGDAIEDIRRQAAAMSARAEDLTKLADDAQPLYSSLDETQKRSFLRAMRERNSDR
jgi:citrate synthase